MKNNIKSILYNLLFSFIAILPMEIAYVITGSKPNAHRVTYSLISLMLVYFVLRNIYAINKNKKPLKHIIMIVMIIIAITSYIIMGMDIATYLQTGDYLNVTNYMNMKLDIVFIEMSIYRYHVIAMVISVIFTIFILLFKAKAVNLKYFPYYNCTVLILVILYLTLGVKRDNMYGRLYNAIYYSNKVTEITSNFRKPKNHKDITFDQLTAQTPDKPQNIILFFIEAFDGIFTEHAPVELPTFAKFSRGEDALYFSKNAQIPNNVWTAIGMTTANCGVYGLAYRGKYFTTIKLPKNLICLGNILHKAGYYQTFVAGDDKNSENTNTIYEHQKFDEILDYKDINKAYPNMYLDSKTQNQSVTDNGAFRFAKDKIKELENKNQPFNFVMYTRNTHVGYGVSKECDKINDKITTKPWKGFGYNSAKRVKGLACDDVYMKDFLNFMKANGYDKNTKIIIMGDHTEQPTNRNIYTAILNSGKTGIVTKQIQQTDMAPTVLGLLGIKTNNEFYYGNNLMEPIIKDKNINLKNFYDFMYMFKLKN